MTINCSAEQNRIEYNRTEQIIFTTTEREEKDKEGGCYRQHLRVQQHVRIENRDLPSNFNNIVESK